MSDDPFPRHLNLDQCRQRLKDPTLSNAERVRLLCYQSLCWVEKRQYTTAIACCDEALQLQPDSALAHYNRGIALEQTGKFQTAIASYDRAIEFSSTPDAEIWNSRGNALRSLGHYAEALNSYTQALALQPDHVAALSSKGSLLALLGRKREALTLCDRALKLQPDSAQVWNSRGVVLSVAGRTAEALQHFDKALTLQPNFDRALCNRGVAQLRLEQYPEAIASLEAALQQHPQRPEAWHINAWTCHGYALMKQGQYGEAIASFDQALNIQPNAHPAAFYRMLCLAMSGQFFVHLSQKAKRQVLLRNFFSTLFCLRYRLLFLLGVILLLNLSTGALGSIIQQALPLLLSVGIIALIVVDLWQHRSRLSFVWKTYFHNGLLTYVRAFITVVVTLTTYGIAETVAPPFLQWGWANWVFGQPGNIIFQPFNLLRSQQPAPLHTASAHAAQLGLQPETPPGFDYAVILIGLFWLLLLMGIPFWAKLEERIFRQGANTWRQIAVRSTQFGLAHLLAGIPILGGIVLILPGFLFACRYKYVHDRHLKRTGNAMQAQDAGVAASTADHAVYNAILVTLAVAVLLLLK